MKKRSKITLFGICTVVLFVLMALMPASSAESDARDDCYVRYYYKFWGSYIADWYLYCGGVPVRDGQLFSI